MAEITLVDVAPRDGLQNEKRMIPTADKVKLIDLLSACGFRRIEAASFVSPKWVPQMADGAEVFAGLTRRAGTRYAALTPNLRGYDAAIAAGVDEVAVFAAASESFSQKNINCSIAESFDRFQPILDAGRRDGIPVRGYISCVVDCPYEGAVNPEVVGDIAAQLMDKGCYEVSLGDTTGRGVPATVSAMLEQVVKCVDTNVLAGHYHDTGGRACDNILTSLEFGLAVYDTAVGGLGGCPYAPGAKGNVATDRVVKTLSTAGHETGLDPEALRQATEFALTLRGASGG